MRCIDICVKIKLKLKDKLRNIKTTTKFALLISCKVAKCIIFLIPYSKEQADYSSDKGECSQITCENCQKSRKKDGPIPGACNQNGAIYQSTVSTSNGREET
jgi:RNase P subunit RPR2